MSKLDPNGVLSISNACMWCISCIRHLPARRKRAPVPRTGGTTISTLLAKCHRLIQATSSFSFPPVFQRGNNPEIVDRFRDPTLYLVQTAGEQLVNVDLDSLEGVQRAVNGGLIEMELADVVAVPDVRLGSLLFGDSANPVREDDSGGGAGEREHRAVLFAMFRHPVDRAVSWFHAKQSEQGSIHYDPSLAASSLSDWVGSPSYVTDYMVRTLVGKVGGNPVPVPLTHDDLDVAKEILRRKCVVGLLDEKGASVRRFERFFGWGASARGDASPAGGGGEGARQWGDGGECADRLLNWDWEEKGTRRPDPVEEEEGSTAWKLVESRNQFDIEVRSLGAAFSASVP